MTDTLIRFDTETGEITHYCKAPDGHDPTEYQLIADIDLADVPKKKVDTSVDPPELADDPDYDPRSDLEQRVDDVEDALAVDVDEPKQGISARLDDIETKQAELESRIEDLESHHA